jgi:hypothetical protein
MTILQRYPNQSPAPDIGCPRYQPRPSSRRCQHYLDGGACALASEFMCVEWLKANRHLVPENHPSHHDTPLAQPTLLAGLTPPTPEPAHARAPITPDELESFKALGVELCLDLGEAGPVWLVPRYTGQGRKEITPEHAATLRLLLDAFPGARIAAFEKATLARGEEAQA